MKTVGVKFKDNYYDKQYHFKTFFNNLEIGDLVVVDTINGLQVVEVSELDVSTSMNVTKYVVDRVDMTKFNYIKEITERKAQIIQELDKKLLEQSRVNKYKILADTDEEARKLIDELESINF